MKKKEFFNNQNMFKQVYRFTFSYACDETKSMGLDLAVPLLKMVMCNKFELTQKFCKYLKEQNTYKRLNLDQWTSFLELCYTVSADFSNYDQDAWPTLLDDFVNWALRKVW